MSSIDNFDSDYEVFEVVNEKENRLPYYYDGCLYNTDNGVFDKMRVDGTEHQIIFDLTIENYMTHIQILDGWVYHSNLAKEFAKMRLDGTNREVLFNGSHSFYAADDGWVYYENFEDKSRLYKIKLDGTGKQKLSDEGAYSIIVADGWVFASGGIQGGYKIRTDGTDMQKTGYVSFDIFNDRVYYIKDGNLCKIRPDGTEEQKLI